MSFQRDENDIKLALADSRSLPLCDMYRILAKLVVRDISPNTLKEMVVRDYRLISLMDISQLTLSNKKTLVDLNIEAFYELYKSLDLVFYQYVVDHPNAYPNIYNTMVNSLREHTQPDEALNFIMNNYEKFKDSWAIINYFDNYPNLFDRPQINFIIDNGLTAHATFIDEYSNQLMKYEEMKTLAKSIINQIATDSDFIYDFIDRISVTDRGGDFVHIVDELEHEFDYPSVIKLIRKIQQKEGDHQCVDALVRICINNNWLEVFDDAGLDYMSYSNSLYSSEFELDLTKIKNFDGEKFVRNIMKYNMYVNWNGVKRFISWSKYAMIKVGANG